MYHLKSEKIVRTLCHYEDHWYMLKTKGNQNRPLRHLTLNTFFFRVKSIYCYKLSFVREVRKKPTIGYISYSIMWKFMGQYVMIYSIKCFLQVNTDSKNKNLIIYCLFNIFNKAYHCMYGRKIFFKSNFFLYRTFCNFKNAINLLCIHFSITLSRFDSREMDL